MTILSKMLAPAGLALCALTAAVPATAQVEGRLGTASISRAVVNTTAVQNAFPQIQTTYQAQIQSAQTKQGQLTELLRPFDTNGDGQINGAEGAALESAPNLQQIQTLRGEIAAIEDQVTAAQVYAVEQVLVQYQAAVTEVTTQQQIVMVIDPASLQFVSPGADITDQLTTSLNAKVPSVAIVPPQGWRPAPESVQIFQEIQQRILIQRARAAQQQAAQQGTQQPAPTGR